MPLRPFLCSPQNEGFLFQPNSQGNSPSENPGYGLSPCFQFILTSQKEVATAPGIECTQGEAGEDHCCAHESSGKDAVKVKTIS